MTHSSCLAARETSFLFLLDSHAVVDGRLKLCVKVRGTHHTVTFGSVVPSLFGNTNRSCFVFNPLIKNSIAVANNQFDIANLFDKGSIK